MLVGKLILILKYYLLRSNYITCILYFTIFKFIQLPTYRHNNKIKYFFNIVY